MSMPSPAEVAYQEAHINDTRVPDMLAAFIFSLAIAYVSVGLRYVSRRVKQQQWLMDDWVILGSLVVTTAYIGTMLAMIHFGYGHHAITVTNPAALTIGLLIAEVLYSISIALIKTSTLFLLHRVFPSPRLTPYLWATGVLVHAYSLVLGVTVMTQCTPLPALWVPELAEHAKCIKISTVFIVCSSLNALTDLIMLILPMPLLWKLNMDTKRKLQVTGIMMCGALVFAISIVRAPELVDVSPVDPSWSDVNGGIWSAVESGVGTMCACLPTFGVLFTAIKTRASKYHSYKYRIEDTDSVRGLSGRSREQSGCSTPGGTQTSVAGKDIRVLVNDERVRVSDEVDIEIGVAEARGVPLTVMPSRVARPTRVASREQSNERYTTVPRTQRNGST